MKTVNVTLRIDEDLKADAEALFEDIGLSLNAACRIFLKRAVQEQRIPFELGRPDRKTLKAIADARGQKLHHLALQWVLRDPVITSALIGASRPEQIIDNASIVNAAPLTEAELRQIDEALA